MGLPAFVKLSTSRFVRSFALQSCSSGPILVLRMCRHSACYSRKLFSILFGKQMPIEPSAFADINIDRFRDAQVVAEYASANGPMDCEPFVFGTYIAPGSDVLDLGAGAGRTAAILAPLARNYLGIDYSEKMVDAARQKFPQCQFAVMDAANLSSLASETFDVIVFSFNGLGHLYPDAKRLQCIGECHRLLRKQGIFIFSLHNANRLFIRPRRTARSLVATIKALVVALRCNAKRGVLTRAYWRGHGYIAVSAHGGVTMFAASVEFVQREFIASGFTFVAAYAVSENVTLRRLAMELLRFP